MGAVLRGRRAWQWRTHRAASAACNGHNRHALRGRSGGAGRAILGTPFLPRPHGSADSPPSVRRSRLRSAALSCRPTSRGASPRCSSSRSRVVQRRGELWRWRRFSGIAAQSLQAASDCSPLGCLPAKACRPELPNLFGVTCSFMSDAQIRPFSADGRICSRL